MFELIRKLVVGHNHKWKTIRTVEIHDGESRLPIGTAYHIQCEVCGKISKVQV